MFSQSLKFYQYQLTAKAQRVDRVIQDIIKQRKTDFFKNIKPTATTERTIKKYFECNICFQIVVEPRSCEQCNKLNCGQCISQWLKQDSRCPSCRTRYYDKHFDRNLKLQLEEECEYLCNLCEPSSKFSADQKILSYHEALQHHEKCSSE